MLIEGGELVVLIEGLERLLCPRWRVAVPLRHITDAQARPLAPHGLLEHLRGLMQSGTHVPGIMRVGTFADKDGLVFYAVRDGRRAVSVELEGERLRRLVLEPPEHEEPLAWAARLRELAAAARRPA
jgi:hypothetical protein